MSGEVIGSTDGIRLSLSSLAREFGCSRETVSRRLREAGVMPDGDRRGHPVFRLKDACAAILRPLHIAGAKVDDPDALPPRERKDWFDSELKNRQLQQKDRHLVPAGEFEAELSTMLKLVVQNLDSLPDVLERDCGISGAAVERVQRAVDALREALYRDICTTEEVA